MSVLFGHPCGNPNSFQAAMAHYEAGHLDVFCLPWMPSRNSLRCLQVVPGLRGMADRLSRRHCSALLQAPRIQGRFNEWYRLALRAVGKGGDHLSYEANDWLMRTMKRECHRSGVSAIHAYEDCSLWQFQEAKQYNKACIYDMPIGFYKTWEQLEVELIRRYSAWLPSNGMVSSKWVRPEQKQKEMELADLVLVPGSFVASTVREFYPEKKLAIAPYGVDLEFWQPPALTSMRKKIRFIIAGQLSLRKGIPLLLEAWQKAALKDAELYLVGIWQLSGEKYKSLPAGVTHLPPCSSFDLKAQFQDADIFVFPSNFEGLPLVLIEALGAGLPAIASASIAADVMDDKCGTVIPPDNPDALIEALRWHYNHRDDLPAMRISARKAAEKCTWKKYRHCVSKATAPYI